MLEPENNEVSTFFTTTPSKATEAVKAEASLPAPVIRKTESVPKNIVKKATNNTSGKFVAKIKKNLKPKKQQKSEKTHKGGKFWAILFGIISIITFLLLFSEQSWVFWFISMISMTIALLINPDVAEIMAMISIIVCLVLIIIGLTGKNAMALLLGLLMLIYIGAIIGIT
ncbi:MAG: hypothetical protein OHK0045_10390 [Raineya sp.]